MTTVGIEAMNVFGGTAFVDVQALARHRGLDHARFENLLMKEKTVALPWEDPVSYAVNAAAPVVDALDRAEKDSIELLITCSESGIDFGKSMSTYVHHYLGLGRHCRLFELKQACYAGTAGLQMAINFVLSQTSPGAKALVVATDISRFKLVERSAAVNMEWSFAEPSSGAGAVALLVSETPYVYQADVGANGYYGYEVMDTCRPVPDSEAGDSDLSLMSYLDCCEQAFLEYQRRVEGADYRDAFQYLSFHTPFGGMVKGAHRKMMRKFGRASAAEIDDDFRRRVAPGLSYCQRVGNIMGATVFLSLAGTIDRGEFEQPKRVGVFSYGSGCCSEFYSGVVTLEGQARQRRFDIGGGLARRHELSMDQYDRLLGVSKMVEFGTRNVRVDADVMPGVPVGRAGSRQLILKEIREFHRKYEWVT